MNTVIVYMNDHHDVDLKGIAWNAMGKYGFSPEFPHSVIREVNAMDARLSQKSLMDVRDMRSLLWSSIDNNDSLDLDQIEYCERRPDDEILVWIAIADVDRYVRRQLQTDLHAAHNGTSVYTGIETFPMLPDRLSKGISSLLPGQDRMAIVIEYTVLPDGSTRHGEPYRALVTNRAKLIYEEVGDWLEGTRGVPQTVRDIPGLDDQIRLQHEVTVRLQGYRREQGALVLNTVEAQPVVKGGVVRDLVIQRQNQARCLIEEFMVAANGTLVDYLGRAGVPMIQRVVRVPKNWDGIVVTAARYHQSLPRNPDAKALSKFLIRQKKADPERFPDLSLTIVKLLGAGEYMMLAPGSEPFGHFSLAVTDYTHATAPNRRYVDIINQRLLKSVLDREPCPYTVDELVSLSTWLTGREKASKKVERFMRKAVAAVLLHDRIGEHFAALVTGASEKGTYVRLISPPAEGRVLSGEGNLLVGQKITVRLVRADPYSGFIDFACIGREASRTGPRAFSGHTVVPRRHTP
ncbi:RNB domain-containing ribonuclease [Methanosphaerula palustris]|uniref:Ribonuclease II n=1 Tax=Methanosphaerula palustris (strain ATCC BAA-1556 / DSM 19958 / E1-9c) TaxID=521011 RepID=B8GHD2_METPE|nr:RNB domain-containing ribonuclease [Methanosphaerula palustris]ACL16537.1 ribonuclease II [Methanosphaerula palustris E1-9c]